ncbi:polyprenyl synthetase family protein [Methanogenium organophilum]|uniref:Polyprenyl synthetase family protein n=1 Tax=Methanogenium organophilum TaxID=2199 RepID=A0A9X9T9Q0_METOG|nr:polyprenyl synthetase family protein [Methanogenium organophilum]WAI02621.1 polyprenyl synthetase family protein [Methanogenium organophilum]
MDLGAYLEGVAEQIDIVLDREFGTLPGQLNKASAHLLLAGGKRLRPAVVMLAADLIENGKAQDILPAALALEVTHTFTLVHDDIMDGDAVRRGVPTVHTKWDEPTAILAGDVLYAHAFELICAAIASDISKVRSVNALAKACADLCEGQHMDIDFGNRSDVDEIEYIEMVSKKTGILYAAAAAIGATLAGGSVSQVNSLYEWGLNSGIAFQIQDDLIDLMADAATSGKDRASDLREGKQTLVAIMARERGIDLTKYRKPTLADEEIDEAIALLEDGGVIADVRNIALERVLRAKKMLTIFPDCDEKDGLLQITDYFVSRGF